jgi:hypothetical protein
MQAISQDLSEGFHSITLTVRVVDVDVEGVGAVQTGRKCWVAGAEPGPSRTRRV